MTPAGARRRAAVLALVLCAGLGSAPAADAAVPELAGTTVVSGSGIGALRVRLTRPVQLSLRANRDGSQGQDATFDGPGRLLALGLVREPLHDEVWLLKSSICDTRGCTSPTRPFTALGESAAEGQAGSALLEPGTYSLYWATDGKPASVTLRLRGLTGRTALRPPPVPGIQWGAPKILDTVHPVTRNGVRRYAGDARVRLRRKGLVISASWMQSNAMMSRTSTCLLKAGAEEQPAEEDCPPRAAGSRHAGFTLCPGCSNQTRPVELFDDVFGVLFHGTPVLPGSYTLKEYAEYAGEFGWAGGSTVILEYL